MRSRLKTSGDSGSGRRFFQSWIEWVNEGRTYCFFLLLMQLVLDAFQLPMITFHDFSFLGSQISTLNRRPTSGSSRSIWFPTVIAYVPALAVVSGVETSIGPVRVVSIVDTLSRLWAIVVYNDQLQSLMCRVYVEVHSRIEDSGCFSLKSSMRFTFSRVNMLISAWSLTSGALRCFSL